LCILTGKPSLGDIQCQVIGGMMPQAVYMETLEKNSKKIARTEGKPRVEYSHSGSY